MPFPYYASSVWPYGQSNPVPRNLVKQPSAIPKSLNVDFNNKAIKAPKHSTNILLSLSCKYAVSLLFRNAPSYGYDLKFRAT